MGLISRVSSRTYRDRSSQTRQKKWQSAKISAYPKDPKREERRRSSTHSPKRTGTTLKPQPSSKNATSERPSSPGLSVTRSPLMDLNFHGMKLTRDKVCSMVKKWQTMIQASVDVKTTDGYQLRLFAVAFTKRQERQEKKTTYAQSHQVKLIRKQMVDFITKNVAGSDIVELIKKLLPDAIATDIQKSVEGIYPVENCHISKVKVVKRPKLDLHRLAELHGDVGSKTNAKGEKVDR